MDGTVTAFDVGTGRTLWSAGDGELCGAGNFDRASGFVWRDNGAGCTVLERVDTRTGRTLAHADLRDTLG